MTKNKSAIFMLIITTLLFYTIIYGDTGFEYDGNIRVGLIDLYENQSKITINNKSISVGYMEDDEYIEEVALYSSGGFTIKPSTKYFVVSDVSYDSYSDVLERAEALSKDGYDTYLGCHGLEKWKVYIGNVDSESEAIDIYNQLESDGEKAYSIYGDYGHRTIMSLSDSYSIIYENQDNYVVFKANSLTDNVPVLDLGKRSYRGYIEIGRYNTNTLDAINIVTLNEYLFGVLPAEMPRTYPAEALKAQAVAARNYVIYYTHISSKYPDEAYDVTDTVSSQVYKGFNYEYDETNEAVLATENELIYSDDQVVVAFFFSTSGGHTESSENVWSSSTDYLVGKADIYETTPERDAWIQELSADGIENKLLKYGVDVGTVKDVEVTDYASSGRVMGLKIIGSKKTYTLEKETIRYCLGLNSRKFKLLDEDYDYEDDTTFSVMDATGEITTINYKDIYVVDSSNSVAKIDGDIEQVIISSNENMVNYPVVNGDDDVFSFAGIGWGHGVGMSQSGAKGMALAGFTYKEILEHYYTDTVIK